jgi:hypothetical protein
MESSRAVEPSYAFVVTSYCKRRPHQPVQLPHVPKCCDEQLLAGNPKAHNLQFCHCLKSESCGDGL